MNINSYIEDKINNIESDSYLSKRVNKLGIKETIENINIVKTSQKFTKAYTKFKGCKFNNSKYFFTIFHNCYFENCEFRFSALTGMYMINCIFNNCNFYDSEIQFGLEDSILKDCSFNSCFTETNEEMIEFNKAFNSDTYKFVMEQYSYTELTHKNVEYINVKYENCSLINLSIKNPILFNVVFSGVMNVKGLEIINPRNHFDLRFSKNVELQCDELTRLPQYKKLKKILNHKMNNWFIMSLAKRFSFLDFRIMYKALHNRSISYKKNLNNLVTIYFEIAKIMKSEDLLFGYSDHYYTAMKLHSRRLKKMRLVQSKLADYTCGYGEKWYRGLFISLTIVVLSSFIYLSGLEVNETKLYESRIIQYQYDINLLYDFSWILDLDWLQYGKDFLCCLYFSMMTFTTVGYGNMQAVGEWSHVLSFFEMFIGVIMIAITTGSLLRKLFR